MIALIQASGMSKRMGENKLLIDFDGIPILEHTIKVIKKGNFKDIILVYKDEEIRKLGEKYNLHTVLNDNYKLGQSESIKAGINNINCKYDGIMFFTGDQPFMREETINEIILFFKEKGGIVIPRVFGERKSPTIFSERFEKELLNLKGDIGGRPVIKNNSKYLKFIDIDREIEFFDIDTKEDLKKARTILASCNLNLN